MHVWMMVPKWLYDMIWYDIWFDLIWWVWSYDKYDDISINRYDMIWHDKIWYKIIQYNMIWYDKIWYDMTWHDMIWYFMMLTTFLQWLLWISYDDGDDGDDDDDFLMKRVY